MALYLDANGNWTTTPPVYGQHNPNPTFLKEQALYSATGNPDYYREDGSYVPAGTRPSSPNFVDKTAKVLVETAALLGMGAGAGGFLGAGGAVGAGAGAGAGATAAGAGTGATAAGTGAALGTEAAAGGALGSGLTAGTTTGGIGGGALGSGLTAGTTASGLGAGATGTGIAAAAPAGTALAPGFFAAEGVGAGGGALAGGADAGSSLAPTSQIGMADLARGIPGLLGAIGANQQSNAYSNLAGQYQAMGAPYRSRLSELYSNPDDFLNSDEVQIPIQQATNILARSLSRGGNPMGSGNALQELQNYAAKLLFGRLGEEKDRLAGFGGLTAYNQAAPRAASDALGAQKGVYDALGAGAADIFNPRKNITLQDLMRMQ